MKQFVQGLYVFIALSIVAPVHSFEIEVFAGSNARDLCPVVAEAPAMDAGLIWLQAEGSDEAVACQVVQQAGKSLLHFIVNDLKPFEKRVYHKADGKGKTADAVSIEENGATLKINIDGKPFTEYRTETSKKQPLQIFYPLFGPQGVRMTRGFPMEKFDGESEDHPHHQSLWVSHGDVNGVNFWHLGDNQGYQRHQKFASVADGPVCGRIEQAITWENEDGKKLLNETRTITIWGTGDDARMMDFDIVLTPADGDVTFGDTKEGGLLSLRTAYTMREVLPDKKKGTGLITNAEDATTAKNTWGKPSPWCDYSGPVGGTTAGLTIMDNPENVFYPTRYHVRDYGLFTANPFGLSHFIGKDHDGTRVLKSGETWRQQYRLYIHAGDVNQSNVKAMYVNYADGPRVVVK
ncbi:MAG: PmoA family protein [Candidatus Hinthialibacter antarcticus]|nr:PmoA family protein [Candidatus Hinthialibacter antarcticus]